MKPYDIWPVARTIDCYWRAHRERKRAGALECVCRALKAHPRQLQEHERYDYEKLGRTHFYGKRHPDSGVDLAADLALVIRELWASGSVGVLWAHRAAKSLLENHLDSVHAVNTFKMFERLLTARRRRPWPTSR